MYEGIFEDVEHVKEVLASHGHNSVDETLVFELLEDLKVREHVVKVLMGTRHKPSSNTSEISWSPNRTVPLDVSSGDPRPSDSLYLSDTISNSSDDLEVVEHNVTGSPRRREASEPVDLTIEDNQSSATSASSSSEKFNSPETETECEIKAEEKPTEAAESLIDLTTEAMEVNEGCCEVDGFEVKIEEKNEEVDANNSSTDSESEMDDYYRRHDEESEEFEPFGESDDKVSPSVSPPLGICQNSDNEGNGGEVESLEAGENRMEEMLEENNNDPNNNLEDIEVMEQNNAAPTVTENLNIEKEPTENKCRSPKPGCSKDSYYADTDFCITNDSAAPSSENQKFISGKRANVANIFEDEDFLVGNCVRLSDTKIGQDVFLIQKILPHFTKARILSTIMENQDASNRIEIALWELLPDDKPAPVFHPKRKQAEDNCPAPVKKFLQDDTVQKKNSEASIPDNLRNREEPATASKSGIIKPATFTVIESKKVIVKPAKLELSAAKPLPAAATIPKSRSPGLLKPSKLEHLNARSSEAKISNSVSGHPKNYQQNFTMVSTAHGGNNEAAPSGVSKTGAIAKKPKQITPVFPKQLEDKPKDKNAVNNSAASLTKVDNRDDVSKHQLPQSTEAKKNQEDTLPSKIQKTGVVPKKLEKGTEKIAKKPKDSTASVITNSGTSAKEVVETIRKPEPSHSVNPKPQPKQNLSNPTVQESEVKIQLQSAFHRAAKDTEQLRKLQSIPKKHENQQNLVKNDINYMCASTISTLCAQVAHKVESMKIEKQILLGKGATKEVPKAEKKPQQPEQRQPHPQNHPQRVQPAQLPPRVQQPARSHPQIQQPTHSHPQVQQPARAHPQMQQAAQAYPQVQQPVRSHPQIQQPAHSHLQVQQPARSHPQIQQPPQAYPQVQQPVRSHPQIQQPAHSHLQVQQPARSHPQIQQPAHSHPQVQQPARSHPQMQQPARSYPQMQQPAQAYPQVQQPVRSHPQVQQPAHAYPQVQQRAQLEPRIQQQPAQRQPEPQVAHQLPAPPKTNIQRLQLAVEAATAMAGPGAEQQAGAARIDRPEGVPVPKELLNPLLNMFPDVDPNYITELCVSAKERNEGLESLVEVLLINGAIHPRVINPDPEPQELNPDAQYENLQGIFPDAHPEYLRGIAEKYYNDPEAMKNFVQAKLENPDYPTMADHLKKMKITEQIRQYTVDFNAEKFLQIFPDPWAHFEDPKRRPGYNVIAFEFLKSHFRSNKVATILSAYRSSKNLYHMSLAAKTLEKIGPDMKTRRTDRLVPSEDIPLLQEFAFIKHKAELKEYISAQKEKEEKEFKRLKAKNELLECQCCYDEECMPSKCSTCSEGHVFCKLCIKTGSETKIGEGQTQFKCFVECKGEFTLPVLQNVLEPTTFSILLRKRQEEEVKAAGLEGLVACPFCHFASIPPPEDKVFKCLNPECMKETCRLCKELNHVPLRCDEVDKGEEARHYLEEKMTEALVRKCYRCSRPFFKDEGCNKMTCPCGAMTCYICGEPVKDYKHFNGQGSDRTDLCPLWSDNQVLNAQTVRVVAEAAQKEILKKNPNLKIDAQALMPSLPKATTGPHQHIANAHVLPVQARRV